MPPVVLKLFAGQGTGQTDKAATICFPPLGSIITISGRFNIDNNVCSKCQHFISTKFRYHKLNTGHVLSQKYKVLIKSLQYWYW